MYGRAISLYPRTLEFLDQLGILEELEQIGVLLRANGTFDHKGQRVPSRGWNQMFKHMESTFLKYVLNVRLYYTEETLERFLACKGIPVHVNNGLKDLKVDSEAADGYKVTATVETLDGKEHTVKR
jgi:phenol 2-monooxygenase